MKYRSTSSTEREEGSVKNDAVVENQQYQDLHPSLLDKPHTYESPTLLGQQFTSSGPEYEVPEINVEYMDLDIMGQSADTESPYMELNDQTMEQPNAYQTLHATENERDS